ncbi:MAG: phenylalanine--tRNA ligase subunit beta, partial [Thaumarchaeota archaeon]|nr:phenylalanine--tRNA ligase subunit beta [Nitrososphaerota archaeon]
YSSPVGIARDAKGLLEIELRPPKYRLLPARTYIDVDPRLKRVRPYVAAAIVKNLKIGPDEFEELIAMQEDLHWIMGRDRRKVAIGLHDFDAVKPPFHYVAAKGDEYRFTPLGGNYPMTLDEILEKHEKGIQYGHIVKGKPYYPLIIDSENRVLSFPPIINARLTEITEKTRNLFIDVTGTDLNAVLKTMNILTTTFADMGGKVERVKVKYGDKTITTPDYKAKKWSVKLDDVSAVLGMKLTVREAAKALRRMRYLVKVSGRRMTVEPPPYRVDLMHEIDLIEDVAIGLRYEKLEPKQPEVLTYGKLHSDTVLEELAREVMIGLGFTEVMNFTLTNPRDEYERMCVKPHPHITLRNPASSEYTMIRTWLVPSLMKTLSANVKSIYPQRIFEIGDVIHLSEEKPEKTIRKLKLAAASCHTDASYTEMKSIVEELLKNFTVNDWNLREYNSKPFLEGRAAEIVLENLSIGFFGEIHPEVLEEWDLTMPTAALEIDLTAIKSSFKT